MDRGVDTGDFLPKSMAVFEATVLEEFFAMV
jgi:hypothetical protein